MDSNFSSIFIALLASIPSVTFLYSGQSHVHFLFFFLYFSHGNFVRYSKAFSKTLTKASVAWLYAALGKVWIRVRNKPKRVSEFCLWASKYYSLNPLCLLQLGAGILTGGRACLCGSAGNSRYRLSSILSYALLWKCCTSSEIMSVTIASINFKFIAEDTRKAPKLIFCS